ncbi:MAG: hypothetical protein ACPG6V_13885, partial [Flavobacteriales bacterium]
MKTSNAAVSALKQKIKLDSHIALDQTYSKAHKIKIGGTLMSLRSQQLFKLPPNAFYGKTSTNWSGDTVITMVLGKPYDNAFITEASYYLENTITGDASKTLFDQITLESTDEGLKILFFPEGCEIETSTDTFEPAVGKFNFVAEITLDNGDEVNIDTTIHIGTNVVSKFEGMGVVTNDPDALHNEVPLYGVSKLGIADFRRVEQEISCYVPGEVSHIENVMAREYKERFSRKQKTIDVTTEQTSETEVENLTDTTTTERNELSSEASSVLNEDSSKNYGASAGVSGNFGKNFSFNANTSMNLSSSSSSSDSNSMAKTYAQDVTERALERVVNKVSSKRTSRMLQEFEEHNKHGFDNTEGDKNITGVYRWVDKIYKNNLINYGKRLMYEFAIPEPAKFYKEAIVKRAVKGNNEKPIPEEPIDIKTIGSAQEITEENYLKKAAFYGAVVEAPIAETITVSKSYSFWSDRDSTGALDDYAATLEDVRIPDNYEAIDGLLNGAKDIDTGNFYCDVIVGNDRIDTGYSDGEFDLEIDLDSPIIEKVPV